MEKSPQVIQNFTNHTRSLIKIEIDTEDGLHYQQNLLPMGKCEIKTGPYMFYGKNACAILMFDNGTVLRYTFTISVVYRNNNILVYDKYVSFNGDRIGVLVKPATVASAPTLDSLIAASVIKYEDFTDEKLRSLLKKKISANTLVMLTREEMLAILK